MGTRRRFIGSMWLPLVAAPRAYARRNAAKAADWPQFRGPNAAGVSPARNLPPSKRLVVLCVDPRNGRIRWEREAPAGRVEIVHPRLGSPASSTPVTDGQRVFAFFGAVGVVALDFRGRLLWRRELGPFTYHLGWGAASSPVLYGRSVILNCDHDGDSFLIAIDTETGKEKWRSPRPGDHSAATGEYSASVKARRRPDFNALFANHDGDRDGKLSPPEVPHMRAQVFARIDTNRDGAMWPGASRGRRRTSPRRSATPAISTS
jgi:hypothetical protein